MAKYSGSQFSLLLVDGYNLISSLSSSASMSKESLTEMTMPFGASSEQNTPINVEKGMLSIGDGFFDTATDAIHTSITGFSKIVRIICAAIEDNVIGKHFIGYQGAYDQKYEVMSRNNGLTKAQWSAIISGDVNEGIITQNLATFTASWDTKTGGSGVADAPVDYTVDPSQTPIPITSCSKANPGVVTTPIAHRLTTGQIILISGNNLSGPVINTSVTVTVLTPTTFSLGIDTSGSTGAGTGGSFVSASTVAGGVGYLQVTAYTGSTGFIDKIMHSPDDSTYAAKVTFSDLGSTHTPAKERIAVTGTIDRYLSNQGNLTGAGSVTAFSGFVRN